MIVYGDPEVTDRASCFIRALHLRLKRLRAEDLTELRTFTILAGALEQGLADAPNDAVPIETLLASRQLTDAAARAFVRTWFKCGSPRRLTPDSDPTQTTKRLEELIGWLRVPEDLQFRIQTPEGFQFHALFPEHYCVTAAAWAEQHLDKGQVLIIGLRSIGTTLSALVCQTLKRLGGDAVRITVRPSGHPFERTVVLPEFANPNIVHALIVDEGPGISGSSMAAVARALEQHGVRSIFFFPGHSNEPGSEASDPTRAVWNRIPRLTVPLSELRWNGRTLDAELLDQSRGLFNPHNGNDHLTPATAFIHHHALNALLTPQPNDEHVHSLPDVHDCSGGLWRQFAFLSESYWPPVAASFERMKFRCRDANGNLVLWKFAGFAESPFVRSGSDTIWKRMNRLADQGFTVRPLQLVHGFIAMPWVEGLRLTMADAIDPHVQERIGQYLVAASEPPLSAVEHSLAVTRLSDLIFWNTKEALGEAAAIETQRWIPAAHAVFGIPSAGDGHLAPHEWIFAAESEQLLKLDCEGHFGDHTAVGPQPILWDVAGALIEWGLDRQNAAPFFHALEHARIDVSSEALQFYLLGYAAFRMGLMSIALSQESDPNEHSRLQIGFYFYQNKLTQLLKTDATSVVA